MSSNLAPSAADLRRVIDQLARPPFSKRLSVVALHDDLPHPDFVALLNEVVAHVDSGTPNSPHALDIRNELPEVTANRIADFCVGSLGYAGGNKHARWHGSREDDVANNILSGQERSALLHLMCFLLSDVQALQQAAYKSRFCRPLDIPLEFSGDDQLQQLVQQLQERQAEFAETLAQAEQMHEASQQTADLKRDISQMEEEKQLVQSKIQLMQRKVADMPNATQWLQAARALRTEQEQDRALTDRVKDLRVQLASVDERLSQAQRRLADTKEMSRAEPQNLLGKLEREVQTNRFLAKEKLPKDLSNVLQAVALLQRIASEAPWGPADLLKLEHEVETLGEELKDLTERRVKNHNTQDKLALFRQQATVVANKRNATADRLREATAAMDTLRTQHAAAMANAPKASSRIPRGDEFKAYVAELRTKSNAYKAKRAELAALQSEFTIAARTREILAEKRTAADRALQALEQRHGVSGLRNTRTTLEEVSGKKGDLDVAKAEAVDDMSTLVQSLVKAVQDKKAVLAPSIAELKQQRAALGELEAVHAERKRAYDNVVLALETEITQLIGDIRGLRAEAAADASRWHFVTHMIGSMDVAMDTVLQEMKVYIGNADDVDAAVKARGFRSWRDLYQRKVFEGEAQARQLHEQLKRVHESHAQNIVQLQHFATAKQLLALRVAANKKLMERAARGDTGNSRTGAGDGGEVYMGANEQRLVIS
ncbi:hypothetical protein H9P43_004266 [Blastocladiella emersonii ATCC 22665]|nr:hypothetical protein H9P43_004266 [Blastocladiella emersonii ATCC 22665]